MSAAAELALLAMDVKDAVAELAARGLPVRVVPATASSGAVAVARWRVARVSAGGDQTPVLVVVPEIEGRIECVNLTPSQ